MTINQIAKSSLANDMLKINTGKRINSAADDAAGLAIAEKLRSQATGLSVGTDNTENMENLMNTAEGALGGVHDMLGRMRELGVQASNGTLTDDDKQLIQTEINEIKEGIKSVAQNTEYNTMKLLDGNFANKNVASNPSGNGMKISIENSSLETLGISDFDVTKEGFDISSIDSAISSVSSSRSSIGSITNALGHVANANRNSEINTISSLSGIEDQDLATAIMNAKKNKAIEQASILGMRKNNENAKNKLNLIM